MSFKHLIDKQYKMHYESDLMIVKTLVAFVRHKVTLRLISQEIQAISNGECGRKC